MQKQNIIKTGLLTLFTFGLYFYYWMYKIKKHLNEKGANIPSIAIYCFMVPLASAISLGIIVGVAAGLSINIPYNYISFIFWIASTSPLIILFKKFTFAFSKHISKDKNRYLYLALMLVLPTITNLLSLNCIYYIRLLSSAITYTIIICIMQNKINQSIDSNSETQSLDQPEHISCC